MKRLAVAALALLLGVLVACSGDDGDDEGRDVDPDSTSSTALIDYSGVALEAVKGTTTSTVVETGTSAIIGTVSGPGGPVPGATVRIERLTGGSSTALDVISGPDGRYEQRNLAGGRYRVRAFLAPSLALVDPEVQFVQAGAEQTIDVAMTDQRGIRARAAVAPSTPYVDGDVNLAVAVGSLRVDADGVVRAVPVSGVRVELVGLGAWTLRRPSFDTGPGFPNRITTTTAFRSSSSVAFTDGLGEAQFELVCQQAGSPGLAVNVAVLVTPAAEPGLPPPTPVQQVQTIPLDVPDCIDPYAVPDTVPTTLLDE